MLINFENFDAIFCPKFVVMQKQNIDKNLQRQ